MHLTKAVTADGKPLPAGTYQVRLTAQEAKPDAVGASKNVERWVEFVQGGTVKGREVVSIVPQAEVKIVVKDAPPPAGGARKSRCSRGNEYVRVWINKGGNHYLIHLPDGRPARRPESRTQEGAGRVLRPPFPCLPLTSDRHHVELFVMEVRVGLDR